MKFDPPTDTTSANANPYVAPQSGPRLLASNQRKSIFEWLVIALCLVAPAIVWGAKQYFMPLYEDFGIDLPIITISFINTRNLIFIAAFHWIAAMTMLVSGKRLWVIAIGFLLPMLTLLFCGLAHALPTSLIISQLN